MRKTKGVKKTGIVKKSNKVTKKWFKGTDLKSVEETLSLLFKRDQLLLDVG